MKKHLSIFLGLVLSIGAFGQTTLNQTTLSSAIDAVQNVFSVASTTNITGCSVTQLCPIYVIDPGGGSGELMNVDTTGYQGVTGSLHVQRGAPFKHAHVTGAIVVIASNINRAQSFSLRDEWGSCVAANTLFTPRINTNNGNEWLCSTVTLSWVPGFNNSYGGSSIAPTAAVASAAGLITPSGPLFHITGTAAITGFNIPTGYTGGPICAIPDGAFTTTTANNIALASTGVVSKILCWTFDWNTAKFYPTY